jgi:5-hydroxyisourate hydrolase
MMGRLSTHILDTANGRPAGNVSIRLYAVDDEKVLLGSYVSNSDGRTEQPLLGGDSMRSGTYELEFDVGDYFAGLGVAASSPAFLNTVVIRFAVDAKESYHVPLLVSPWSYSTYRGS